MMARSKKRSRSAPTQTTPSSLADAAATAARILAGSASAARAADSRASARATNAVEAAFLRSARDVAALAERGGSLREGLARVAVALTDPGLRRGRLEALIERDETRSLALAWAREQIRLALEELLARHADRGTVRRDVPRAALAWALLAGCEAIALEPTGDADERIDALVLLSHPDLTR
jgi:nuclear transport factor 2 (NTF2) superfamily protein